MRGGGGGGVMGVADVTTCGSFAMCGHSGIVRYTADFHTASPFLLICSRSAEGVFLEGPNSLRPFPENASCRLP